MSIPRFAVLGQPVGHSLSPRIHAAFARAEGVQLSYTAIDVPAGGLEAFLGSDEGRGLAGANVTMPHKQAAFDAVAVCSDRAQLAGAVNTLFRQADGSLAGENTDGVGWVRDVRDRLGWPLAGRRVLILGAGGAVRGILGPLLAEGPGEVTIANRTVARADRLAERFAGLGAVTSAGLSGLAGHWDAVVNGLGAGHGGELPELPGVSLDPEAWCYDLSYGAAAAPFRGWAARVGAAAVEDGLGMLVGQAAESFRIWHGVLPAGEPILASLRSAN